MQLRAQAANAKQAAGKMEIAQPRKNVFSTFWQAVTPTTATSSTTGEPAKGKEEGPSADVFEHYLQKTYLKTASLIGKAARAAAILGGHGDEACRHLSSTAQLEAKRIRDAAYAYGRNLGIAFQLVDDLLDFKATSKSFGKPSGGADLRLGLATAPVLYAWQEFPASGLRQMVARKFAGPGDVEAVSSIDYHLVDFHLLTCHYALF